MAADTQVLPTGESAPAKYLPLPVAMGAETSFCGMTWLQAPPFTAEVGALVRADTDADTSPVQAAGLQTPPLLRERSRGP